MMKDLQTLILAAGKGTRMKSDLPKVLHPVCGRPMIDYVVGLARGVGSAKIHLVLGYKNSEVRAVVPKDSKIHIIIQRQLRGTGDAVRSAQSTFRHFDGDILILSGDAILLRQKTLKDLVQRHNKSQAVVTFLTTVTQHPEGYGRIIRGFGGKAVAIREERDATEYEKNIMEINAGVYCFRTPALREAIRHIKINPRKKEYYLTDIIAYLNEQKARIETLETEDPCEGLGINSRIDLARSEDIIRQRILRQFMLNGVTVVDPSTTYIYQNVTIGRDTVIRPFTVIENDVRIGPHCRIGPFARLRPGTRIGAGVELGNFVEVSRSRLGRQCVMKHFSFLGDARIGKNVNIGAGVVTANYDGKNKNITQISDHAFIGSDTIMVAPVKVGQKAMTGAGCVVTRGKIIPAGRVAVGAPARLLERKANTTRKTK